MKAEAKIALWLTVGGVLALLAGTHCARSPAPAPPAPLEPPSPTPETPIDAGAPLPEPLRAPVGKGAELYLSPTFHATAGRYDLVVHFHGEGRWQEANVARSGLAAAVVSVNLGMGTDAYAQGFKDHAVFDRLLAATEQAIAASGRAGESPALGRLALSAWSAGESAIAQVLDDATAARVDALLLADGFFTSFTDAKRRTVDDRGLARFVRFAEAAERDEKLFVLTHTAIPTGPYPSVQECTARLLELLRLEKQPRSGAGPLGTTPTYAVDRGSFHVTGFDGTTAADHVKQLHAQGETAYPLLKARWDARR